MPKKSTIVPPPPPPRPSETQRPLKEYGWYSFMVLLLLLFGLSLGRAFTAPPPVPAVDYSEFYAWLEAGSVESVEISGQALRGTLDRSVETATGSTQRFSTVIPGDDPSLLPLLQEQGVAIRER